MDIGLLLYELFRGINNLLNIVCCDINFFGHNLKVTFLDVILYVLIGTIIASIVKKIMDL